MLYKNYRSDSPIGKYLKEELLKIQNNKCQICKEKFKNSKGIHIDHDHNTGEIRGLLCAGCNRAVAVIDNEELKLKCENYKNIKELENSIKNLEPIMELKRGELKNELKENQKIRITNYFTKLDNLESHKLNMKKMWENPKYRENHKQAMIKVNEDPEIRKKHGSSETSKKGWVTRRKNKGILID